MSKLEKKKYIRRMTQPKYEMVKRKEQWKSLYEPIKKQLMIPLDDQPNVVQDLVNITCYNKLCEILNLPPISTSLGPQTSSVDTMIPYLPKDEDSLIPKFRKSIAQESGPRTLSTESLTETISSIQTDIEQLPVPGTKLSRDELPSAITKTSSTPDYGSRVNSYEVEVEKKIPNKEGLMLKHKAVLKFLELPEDEVATWRKKEEHVKQLNEMNLDEKGRYLIDKVAVEFCEWMRNLGGDEKSCMSEEILKELFEIGMDNPATRGICVKMRENRIFTHKMAEFLEEPDKSFPVVLSQHLRWDAKVEKKRSKLVAFSKHLPKDLQFKTPENKTAETWLEWNKLSEDELNFADVYDSIKELRSTKEYCKWMLNHPEHKRPKHLVNIGMFEKVARGSLESKNRPSIPFSQESEIRKSRLSSTVRDGWFT